MKLRIWLINIKSDIITYKTDSTCIYTEQKQCWAHPFHGKGHFLEVQSALFPLYFYRYVFMEPRNRHMCIIFVKWKRDFSCNDMTYKIGLRISILIMSFYGEMHTCSLGEIKKAIEKRTVGHTLGLHVHVCHEMGPHYYSNIANFTPATLTSKKLCDYHASNLW